MSTKAGVFLTSQARYIKVFLVRRKQEECNYLFYYRYNPNRFHYYPVGPINPLILVTVYDPTFLVLLPARMTDSNSPTVSTV
jgi:hypothetical protein